MQLRRFVVIILAELDLHVVAGDLCRNISI